jgi:hypothetical protein
MGMEVEQIAAQKLSWRQVFQDAISFANFALRKLFRLDCGLHVSRPASIKGWRPGETCGLFKSVVCRLHRLRRSDV